MWLPYRRLAFQSHSDSHPHSHSHPVPLLYGYPTLQHSGAISVRSSHIFNTIFDAHRGDRGSNNFNLRQGCKSQRKKGNRNMARGTAECVASIGKCSIRSCLIQLMSFRTALELWWRMYSADSKFLLCSWPLTMASRIQQRASPSGPSGHDYCNALQRVWPTTLGAPMVMTFPTQLKNLRWTVSRK